jgi:hypothetical protein
MDRKSKIGIPVPRWKLAEIALGRRFGGAQGKRCGSSFGAVEFQAQRVRLSG